MNRTAEQLGNKVTNEARSQIAQLHSRMVIKEVPFYRIPISVASSLAPSLTNSLWRALALLIHLLPGPLNRNLRYGTITGQRILFSAQQKPPTYGLLFPIITIRGKVKTIGLLLPGYLLVGTFAPSAFVRSAKLSCGESLSHSHRVARWGRNAKERINYKKSTKCNYIKGIANRFAMQRPRPFSHLSIKFLAFPSAANGLALPLPESHLNYNLHMNGIFNQSFINLYNLMEEVLWELHISLRKRRDYSKMKHKINGLISLSFSG